MQKIPETPTDPVRRNRTENKIRTLPKKKEPKKVLLDWRGYFLEFCKVHGEPVEFKGLLLFRDGWRYAMEYSGPEHPPPTDHKELDRFVVAYWTIRLRQCKEALNRVWAERERMARIVDQHSLPLKQITIIGEGKERRRVSSDYNTKRIDDRIRWLQVDIVECEKMLQELEQFYKVKDNGTPTTTA